MTLDNLKRCNHKIGLCLCFLFNDNLHTPLPRCNDHKQMVL